MTAFAAIADDLTGACDVAAELATAGRCVRVEVVPGAYGGAEDGGLVVVNTQSRALAPAAAAERVRQALRGHAAPLVLKKIDTALRGHVGAELDAALDMLGAPGFVLAAIPAAGRVTRNGCQWFGGRLLADTEFARDPEGPGAVSSIPVVVGRESRRRSAVVAREIVAAGTLAAEVARQRAAGIDLFVMDAESDEDVARAVGAILALGCAVCLVGSIALAAALAPHVGAAAGTTARAPELPQPALIVNGSLHSRARAQVEAVLATGEAVTLRPTAPHVARDAVDAFRHGTTVVLEPAPAVSVPTHAALRTTETALADAVAAILAASPPATLILIGGETSYAILRRLGTGAIAVHGRIAPLVAYGTILDGAAAGTVLVTKGGSGGEPDVLAAIVRGNNSPTVRSAEDKA